MKKHKKMVIKCVLISLAGIGILVSGVVLGHEMTAIADIQEILDAEAKGLIKAFDSTGKEIPVGNIISKPW